jgi:MFS transporter, DHA1 family, multidrug resistance protein
LLSLAVPHTGGGPLEVLAIVMLRALDGVGAAMLWPAAFAAMGDAVEDDQRQQAMSLLNLCYMLGIALAFPIGGLANDTFGVKWAGLLLAAALFLAVAICVFLLVPARHRSAVHVEEHGEFKLADFIESARQIPVFLILAVITFAGIGFPMAIFKLFPSDQFGMSETAIGALIFPGAIVMAAASVPMSRFGERIGRARAVHVGMGLCALGMTLIALGAIIPPMRQAWLLAVGGIPVGIGFLLAIPAWMASVSDIDPKRRGTNLGAVMTAQGLGAIIGAPIGATFYEKFQPVGVQLGLGLSFGRYSPFVGCAACIIFGWLLSLKILRDPT